MSRINLRIAWLLLLLVPTVAAAQRTTDRSRGRTESKRVEKVDRSVKRTKVATRDRGKRTKLRVREDKVTRNEGKRSDKKRHDAQKKKRRSSRGVVSSPSGSRSSHASRRSDRKKQVKRRHERHDAVKHRRVERKEQRAREAHHRKVHRAKKIHRRKVRANRRHHWRKVNRHIYKHRRYHRHNHRGVSLGFYIRIPTIHWHVGHSRRFVFRQIVSGLPAGEVEIHSTFKRRIRHVRNDYVDVEFELDRMELVVEGRFLGVVDRFPGNLKKVRAKVYRDGFVQFDRMLYVVGNEHAGFELLSTRYCGGDVGRASYECLDTRSGELDFYRERVNSTRYSRFIDLVQTGRAVPISLVPDEEYLGFQYAVGYGHSSDGYYSGSFDYSSLSRYDNTGTAFRLSADATSGSFQAAAGNWSDSTSDAGFVHEAVVSYAAPNGGTLDVRRHAEIEYLKD